MIHPAVKCPLDNAWIFPLSQLQMSALPSSRIQIISLINEQEEQRMHVADQLGFCSGFVRRLGFRSPASE
jgi:hypothetical protein